MVREEPRRATLPPPEWTSPRSPGRSATVVALRALPRRTGARAEEAWMRARLEEARAANDAEASRAAGARLARWLASRDRDLDEAVELAMSTLLLDEDVELRRELSAWLESLGEAARAAATLKPIAARANTDRSDAAYVLVRTGILKARASAAAAAAEAFVAAASVDATDPVPMELLAGLSGWAAASVSPPAAAEAYIEAALRRRALGQDEAALEDLWRALAADPSSEPAASALAEVFDRSERQHATDEVWRSVARALSFDEERQHRVHARRFQSALSAPGDARGLGAALDQGLDSVFEGEPGTAFDAVLLDAGMLEAVAARLEVRAGRARVPLNRASQLVELGRLCAGPLADESRAASAFVSALAADPSCEAAIVGLRALMGEGHRLGETPNAERGVDPLVALVGSVATTHSEADRRAQLVARLGSPFPYLATEARLVDDGSDTRASTARAWTTAAVGSDPRALCAALERVAVTSAVPVRAVLLAVAAERYSMANDSDAARRVATLAAEADPENARCVATLADTLDHSRDRTAVVALEHAISLIGPRATWCSALGAALSELGEVDRAVDWMRRSVAQRPGDREAVTQLLDHLLGAGDSVRLGETLAWVLSQPQPTGWLAVPFAAALRELARLDPSRGAVVARRTLDVFGPKVTAIREAMLDVARDASDDAFAVAILDRWLACADEGADRKALFATMADLRLRLGDTEGEARVVARAIHEGLSSEAIVAHLDRLAAPATPDALLWTMAARAESLGATGDAAAAAWAWRDLGAALWDLADDRMGAITAWRNAAQIAPAREHATFALDLATFAGVDFAFQYLVQLIETEPDGPTAAAIASDVARAALSIGQRHMAFDMAARGVTRSPAHAGVLEVAEQAVDGVDEMSALSDLYELVAVRALGRFGRRAAHYRGARFFDRAGQHELALKHAALAFHAVPSEGSSFQLLTRAAEKAGDRAHAVRTVEQVAERFDRADMRASWLLRAASIAGTGEDASRRKVDVLLRATVGAPSVATVSLLRDAARELLRYEPEERDILEMRIGRAAHAILERLDGPEGARVAVAFATASLDLFGDAAGALVSFDRAFGCDADIDEFAELVPRGATLAASPKARETLISLLSSAEAAHSNAGVPALRVLSGIASALGDEALLARAVVATAWRDPEDDLLVIDADAAARAFPELGERLAQRVGPGRRAGALVSSARANASEGRHGDAARLLERAADLVDETQRAEIERELRAALDAAGRSAEIEERVQEEAANDVSSPVVRADRWSEIAERREARGDKVGAVRALLEACKLDPGSLARWSVLERVAETGGDDGASIMALEQIALRVGAAGRGAVYRRLARAHERRKDAAAAEAVWMQVLALDADDEEADHALEATMTARGQYSELAHHLARRADRLRKHSGSPEILRAVRLRRAAILEQRLGRQDDACDELGLLLGESPNNVGALRYLADLLERQGKYAQSAPLWRRAAAVEPDRTERDELELKAGRAARAAGDSTSALEHANRVLARQPANAGALTLRVDAARAAGGDIELGDALDAAAVFQSDSLAQSAMLMESAQAAARAGDPVRALQRAQRAAAAAPQGATPQLLARGLEYRLRGAGAPDEAKRTIEELGRVTEPLGRDDAALRAFLLAEALETVEGGGAGLRELEAVRSTVGPHPLVALGLAERLAAKGQHGPAVDAYRVALQGSLLDLRKRGSVAVAAADSALRADRWSDARYFLDVAELHEEARPAAQSRRALLRVQEAQSLPPPGPAILGEGRPQETPTHPSAMPGDDLALRDLEAAVRSATTPGERARARLALGRARLHHDDPRGAEPLLWEALADGLIDAGDALAPLIAPSPDRAPDMVRLRRQQVMIEPGDVGRLESLRVAALADDDRTYARAIEHVLRAFDPGAGPLPPPALGAQPEQPGILALLVRPSMDASGEALGLLWEGAMQLFVRDAASYGITGVERVVPGPSSTIARLYEAAMRVLAPPRIPLFLSRSAAAAPSAHIALLAPPAVVLVGDVREESAELRFTLGRGMSAALAHNVLRLGLTPTEGRAVVDALRAAFGPPEIGRRVDPRAARLAESFWHIVPARTQRRLQEMLGAAANMEYEQLVASAQQSGRRVGMFLAGDLACASRVLVAESVPRLQRDLLIDNLRHLCEEVPLLADLVRLAVSREYADARWHAVAPAHPRGTIPTGRFNLF
jgi:cellulose synthase operon protein C